MRKTAPITSIHRTVSYDGEAIGLGCYIQSCEERLMDPQKYDSFIENTINPLVNSHVQSIIVCIDPLIDDSDRDRLTDLANRLTVIDQRIMVIIPETHVNAAVGRNITFNCIRQMENDRRRSSKGLTPSFVRPKGFIKHLLWFGADDDDRIIMEGINGVCQLIAEERFHISTVLTVNPSLNNKWIRAQGQVPTSHYAQWCYCFSPVYYNGLSYPITPLEKEDLDVLNRLFQYPQFFVTLDGYSRLSEASIVYPYEYQGTNPDRFRADELYNRVDVIDYLNAHHSAETKDLKLNAPSADARKRGYKHYYMNDSERYFMYDSIYGSRMKLYYGLALHNDPKNETHADSYNRESPPTLLRLIENAKDPKLKALLYRENFNGDLYMVRYELHLNGSVLHGFSFQNGKDPFDMIADIERTPLTRKLKRRFLEARTVGDDLLATFKCNPLIMSTDKRVQLNERVLQWNANVLAERTPRNYIPLRTFGGHDRCFKRCCLYGLLLLIVTLISFIVAIIVGTIGCSPETAPHLKNDLSIATQTVCA